MNVYFFSVTTTHWLSNQEVDQSISPNFTVPKGTDFSTLTTKAMLELLPPTFFSMLVIVTLSWDEKFYFLNYQFKFFTAVTNLWYYNVFKHKTYHY